jgi:TPR repeat protein
MSFSKELDTLREEAEYDSEAIIELAELYLRHGRRGVPSDYQEVIRLAEKRVEKQTSYTCTVFLRTFKLGDPDPVVRQAAFDYLLPIANSGFLNYSPTPIEFVVLTYVGSYIVSTSPDPSKGVEMLIKASKHPRIYNTAKFNLAKFYLAQNENISRIAESLRMLHELAAVGYLPAMFYFGSILFNEVGILANKVKGRELIVEAAQWGNKDAIQFLEKMSLC